MDGLYYLCFSVNKLPDLTLTKYSVFDGSSVENIMDKTWGVPAVNYIDWVILPAYISICSTTTILTRASPRDTICQLFSMRLHKTRVN